MIQGNNKIKKRIFSGVPSESRGRNLDICGKSASGQTNLLQDLVGVDDAGKADAIEVGSDYPYAKELNLVKQKRLSSLKGTTTNCTSEQKNQSRGQELEMVETRNVKIKIN